ncbi:MAG: tetratricopeptide repeat protein, partial [Azoarcus sp.]|nr:tetratricopeptide repeat protein [Azoarcus sp.]
QPGNREIRLAHARSLILARQYAAARAEFSALLMAAPNDPNLLYTVGMLSFELGDASAELLLIRALDSGHPQADIIRIQLGKIAGNRGEHAAARKWFDAVSSGEHAVEARILSAKSLAKEGRIKQAQKLLKTARNPEDQRRFLLAESSLLTEAGRAKDAFAIVEKALRKSPDDNDLLYESAMLADRTGKHAVMEARLRKLIALAPEHAHAYNALGFSLADRGKRLNEAEKLIARALELLPKDPFILDSMGWVRFKRGDLDGALARLEEAYALRTDPEIAAHLGEVLWRLNRADESRRILDNALAAHPDNAPLQKTMRRLYKSGKKR